jgi:Na+-transporting NADH:ubiquinone oxidoreductase subunit C
VYTLVFILVLSAVFGGLLAGANAWLRPKIDQNALVAEKRSVLYAFGLDDSGTPEAVSERFADQISEETIDGLEVYAWNKDGQVAGYAVPFSGAGLWGTIRGFLAVTADLETVLGLTFVEQNETPGLGGRIDELDYKEQFRNIRIDLQRGFAYGADGGGQIDAITGATSTSRAVLQILNNLLFQTLTEWEVS